MDPCYPSGILNYYSLTPVNLPSTALWFCSFCGKSLYNPDSEGSRESGSYQEGSPKSIPISDTFSLETWVPVWTQLPQQLMIEPWASDNLSRPSSSFVQRSDWQRFPSKAPSISTRTVISSCHSRQHLSVLANKVTYVRSLSMHHFAEVLQFSIDVLLISLSDCYQQKCSPEKCTW